MKEEKNLLGKFAVELKEKETETKKTDSESYFGANWEYIPDWFAISSHIPDKES